MCETYRKGEGLLEIRGGYWTWESPDGETRNQIHFTLSNQRGIVTNCEVITKADIGSDNRLVRMTFRINKGLARLKNKNKKKAKKLLILTHKNSKVLKK